MRKVITSLAVACLMLLGMFALQSSAQIPAGSAAGIWLFDEGQGSVAQDSSGNGNDGAITGAVWVDGKFGKALQFSGAGDYVDCGTDASLNLNLEFTLAAWIKHPPGTEGYIIIRNTSDDAIRQWGLLDYVSAGTLSIFCNTDNARENLDWTPTLDDDTWHHIVLSANGVDVDMIVDGASRGIKQLTAPMVSTETSVWIGKRKPNNFAFTGVIDEVAIFNIALSVSQANDIMSAGLGAVASAVSPSGKLATTWSSIKTQR